MVIRTQQSISGFIASEPRLGHTERGDARLYVRIGQEHYHRNDDGSFTPLDPTFHDLVMFRHAAEKAHERFRKGDRFLAEGYLRTYDHTVDGTTVPREEFVAKRIGHDMSVTRYTVDRSPRQEAPSSLDPDRVDRSTAAPTSDRAAAAGPPASL